MELIQREQNCLLQTYNRLPIKISHSIGNLVYDFDGTEYYDYISGIGVLLLGHRHPKVEQAIQYQISRYLHCSNYFYQDVQIELAEALQKHYNASSKIFFCNSGTEANECAIKIARIYGNENNKNIICSLNACFHGRTYGTLSLMQQEKYKNKMTPFLPDCKILSNDTEGLKHIDKNVSAIFIEFIQGEGGVVEISKEFVSNIFALRKKYNFLIIADEVQTGMGRSGKFFSFEHYTNELPDIITMAKGLGGGLPLGATLVNEKANLFNKGQHGTTFGGNPLACAAGKAVVYELNNGILKQCNDAGHYFKKCLTDLKNKYPNYIKKIRGEGLMLGICFNFEASKIVNLLLEKHKIITNTTASNVLRLLPPLNIKNKDVDYFIESLDDILSDLLENYI